MSTTSSVAEAVQRPSRGRALVAASLLGVAVAAGVTSLQLGLWTTLGPGPGFFPLVISLVLAASSVTWGIEQWRGAGAEPVDPGEEANAPGRIAVLVASLVVAVVLFEPLGFQLTALLFLLFQMRVLARVRWVVTIPLALVGSIGVFALFDVVLGVSLPASSIPFFAMMGL